MVLGPVSCPAEECIVFIPESDQTFYIRLENKCLVKCLDSFATLFGHITIAGWGDVG